MSYGNNSNNIVNILKYNQDQKPENRKAVSLPKKINPQRVSQPFQELDEDDIMMLQPPAARKSFRMKSSRRNPQQHQKSKYYPTPKQQYETDLDALGVKMQQIIEYYDQRHNNLEQTLVERLNGLEGLMMRELPKIQTNNIIKNDVAFLKQNIQEIRLNQQEQSSRIQSIKSKATTKGSFYKKSGTPDSKEKEKMTVLFMEVVRISDMLQKIQRNAGSTGKNYESRIQELQFKLRNSEKNMALLSQNNSTGSELINSFGDKIMDRLQTAESNLLVLGKERVKDKEQIKQLIIQNQRVGKDMEVLIKNLQGDYQNKLESRVSETIKRLMNEHEERVNAQQQLRRNLDVRQKINQEKRNSQKEQIKAKYENLDTQLKTEFHRKEQSIRSLYSHLENQIKNMHKLVYDEGRNRKQQELQFREEMKRIQDNFRKQYDIFKTHQSDVLQKIGEVVREEVQVRVNSEINLKKLTNQIAIELINDINALRQDKGHSQRKIDQSIKQIVADSSQKFNQLSHYMDSEVRKVADVVSQKYSKMKNVFTRLAQQLKEHLKSNEENRQNFEKRLKRLEDNFQILKKDVSGEIDEFESDLDNRFKQEKEYMHTFIFKKTNDLGMRINKLEEQSNQQISLIRGNIQESKEMIRRKRQDSREGRGAESEEEVKQLRTVVFKVKSLTEELRQEHYETLERLKQELKLRDTENRQKNYSNENQVRQKIQKINTEIQQLNQKYDSLSNKVNSLVADGNSSNMYSQDKIKKISEDMREVEGKIRDIERVLAQKSQKGIRNQEEINDMKRVLVELKGAK